MGRQLKTSYPLADPPAFLYTQDTGVLNSLTYPSSLGESLSVFQQDNGRNVFVDQSGYSAFYQGTDSVASLLNDIKLLSTSETNSILGKLTDLIAATLNVVTNTSTVVPGSRKPKSNDSVPNNMGSSFYAFGHTTDEDIYLTNAEATAYALFNVAPDNLPNFEQPYLNELNARITDTNSLLTLLNNKTTTTNDLLQQILNTSSSTTIVNRLDDILSMLNSTLYTTVPYKETISTDELVVSQPVGISELILRSLFSTNPLSVSGDTLWFSTVPVLSSQAMGNFSITPSGAAQRQAVSADFPIALGSTTQAGLLTILPTGGSSYAGNLDPFVRKATSSNIIVGLPMPTQVYSTNGVGLNGSSLAVNATEGSNNNNNDQS